MSFVYTGTPSTVTVDNLYKLTLPQDGIDQASATTVVPAFKIAVDEIAKIGQILATTKLNVCMQVLAGSLVVWPFGPIFVDSGTKIIYMSKSTFSSLTVANKEGGGTFTPGTFYYVYAFSTDGTPNFIISADPPDVTLTTKNTNAANFTRFRYFGSVLAFTTTTIVDFSMTDFDYTFNIPQNSQFTSSNLYVPPSFGASTLCTLNTCPITAKSAKIVGTTGLTSGTGSYFIAISTINGSFINAGGYPGIPVSDFTAGSSYNTINFFQEVPVDVGNPPPKMFITCIINAGTPAANAIRGSFYIKGYKE